MTLRSKYHHVMSNKVSTKRASMAIDQQGRGLLRPSYYIHSIHVPTVPLSGSLTVGGYLP
jgi:hypothetical protein